MGHVEGIFIATNAGEPLAEVPEVRAVAGTGLEGDRYASGKGQFSTNTGSSTRELTLFEAEAVEALGRDYGIEILPSETRRNVMTRGVALNHLVGAEFTVGEVRARGVKLCEPCNHLEGLTKPGVRDALKHRGGLRAEILSDGVIRKGDALQMLTTS